MKKKTKVQIEFGNRIRDMRKKQRLSQEDLALKAGLDRTYISGIERGERNPSLINISKTAKALGLTVKDLF